MSRHDVCLHDKLYTWIILIVILIIVLLIILLIFLIYFALDSCIRHMTDQDRRRRHKAARRQYRNQLSSESEDSSYCNSDDSYIYGKNLSLGDKLLTCNVAVILFNLSFHLQPQVPTLSRNPPQSNLFNMQKSTKQGRISVKVAVINMLLMLQPSLETSRPCRETGWNVRISVKISHLKKSFH